MRQNDQVSMFKQFGLNIRVKALTSAYPPPPFTCRLLRVNTSVPAECLLAISKCETKVNSGWMIAKDEDSLHSGKYLISK